MKLLWILGTTLALFVARGAARAQDSSEPDSLAHLGWGSPIAFRDGAASLAPGARFASAPVLFGHDVAPRLEAVGYRPRSHAPAGGHAHAAPVQIHAGFFEPEGNGPTRFAFGFRGGPAIDEHLQLGFGTDWYHESESRRVVVGQSLQGGQPIAVTRVLASASSDLLPFQAFLQVSGGDRFPLIPYLGVAGVYQLLFLSATDYETGAEFDATFGGWGWQAWGGVALPLSGRSRMFGEAFVHKGDVERDIYDPASNLTYREVVNTDGMGMRLGLSWGF